MRRKIEYIVALLVMVVLFCVAGGQLASAQEAISETANLQEKATEASKWFDNQLLVPILTLIASASGTLAVIKTSLKTIANAREVFSKTKDESLKQIKDAVSKTKEDICNVSTKIEDSLLEQKQIKLDIMDDNQKTREALNKVIEAIKVIYVYNPDPELVKNGLSSEVSKILGGDSDEKAS